ncbi:autotransporter outer membrane beta-barrel domain-containing protein, partial [Helicobacter winghamensis]|uniref:autotransporter outer membrane beta-barrel domain-containing protein n=1 Tax=Helicobacter winghamensis TaxID=157268 RepID=UPI0015D5D9AD
ITNSGELTLTNTGNISQGITNTGTMTLASSIDNGATRAVSNLANGIIGKNNNGVQLENNGVNAKLSIKDWYFKAPEFTTNDERKDGSLLVGGDNIAGISLEKVYINTEDLDIDKIYDSNTFFADKDGNAVGEQINTNQGIDANNIHSISGIYTFESANNNGGYRAKINRAELSGKTLAQSVVYSSRLRNMSVSNLLRATTTQNFATNFNAIEDMELSKEGEAPTDADVLSELEKLYINHNNLEAKNHSFVIPYYQYFSADMEGGSGKLKSNSAGMLIGTQRLLPNDYGILGVYGGFESADQDVSNQRLEFDNKSYFGGLSYYDIFYRKGLTQYFVSLTTNLDYTNADVSKTYTDGVTKVDSTAKIYGYGVNARVGLSHYVLHDYLRVTPEIGFNYLGMHSKDFTLQHLGGTNEHYKAQYFNFIDTVASIKIESPYSNRLRTSFSVGGLYNVYKDAEGKLKLDRNIITSEIDVARWYAFVQMGLSYDFLENANLSLNYNGISTLSSKANSHSVFVKFAWWW